MGTEGREAKGIPDKKETGCPPSSRLITTAPPKPSPPHLQRRTDWAALWHWQTLACTCSLGGPAAPALNEPWQMEPWSAPRAGAPSTPAVAGRSPGRSRCGPLARRPRRRDAVTGERSGRLEGARRPAKRAGLAWHGPRCSSVAGTYHSWPLVPRPQRASPQGGVTQAATSHCTLQTTAKLLQLSAPFGRAACRAGRLRAQACAGCV